MAEKTDDEKAKSRVEGAVDIELAATEDGDIERYLMLLDDDALFLPPDMPSVGGEELRAWLRSFLDNWRVEWLSFKHEEAEICGDLAFHRYSYSWRLEPKAGGQLQVSHGKGLHVLRRLPNGDWKIARKVWNGRPTPNSI
ncbi:MAG: DUF4440 domain-containing protein [Gaiellaceae bacterium]